MPSPNGHLSKSNRFAWQPEPSGAEWLALHMTHFRNQCPLLNEFARALNIQASGRLIDWVDHLQISTLTGIEESGFQPVGNDWYVHPRALLPPVHYGRGDQVYLKVDSVSDFVAANRWKFKFEIHGRPLDTIRIATAMVESPVGFGAIERNGCNATDSPASEQIADRLVTVEVYETFLNRERWFESDEEAFVVTRRIVQAAIDRIGRDSTCDMFFRAERAYWQSRNRAGQIQYMRQQSLGMGWGNHDHHTYRSSRSCFQRLIGLFELLGFECREHFYAGTEAGWGAQVLEHPVCGIVIFADVDLDPSEIRGDIAHEPLPPSERMGTIGLWCALHGEAVFQAGMHHLECQFDFDLARTHLASCGIGSMKPFTDFPHLRQCFTDGERWAVDPKRLATAVRA